MDLAQAVAAEVTALPRTPGQDRVYREEHLLRGLETCDVCGTTVNMGWMVVCNPMAGLYAKLPYLGLHYLEHGSFSYAGDVHGFERAEVPLLVETLHSKGPSHQKARAGDGDGDGLQDREEDWFRTRADQADTDGDGVPDGFRVARKHWRAVEGLPRTPGASTYAVDHLMKGLVTCEVCGRSVNMGYVELVNPPVGLRLEIPYLSLHFMEHGSFGSPSGPRVDPVQLDLLLRPAVGITREPGQVVLRWLGQAGHTYQVETATNPDGPWIAGPTLPGQAKELHDADSLEGASSPRFYRVAEYE